MELQIDTPTSNSREGDHSVIGSAGGEALGNSESATNAGSSVQRVKMRRHRVVLSCKPCHMHKQKCDRQIPCSRCIKRGDPAFCIYENPPAGSTTVIRPSSRENSDLAQRVAQLESLVQASLGGQSQAQVLPNTQSSGASSSHASESAVQVAAAALGELSQQQDRMQDIEENRVPKITAYVNFLPQRALVEELLTFFFDYSSFPLLWHVINRRYFDKLYLAFMARPESVHADFVALLCAVCSISLLFMPEGNQMTPLFPKDPSERQALKSRMVGHAQSTLTSETNQPHSIERIQGLMLLSIYHFNEGQFWPSYNLIGLAIRAAQFAGMHRDPTISWPHIGPDEVEIRRRLWAGLVVLDRKISFLLKKPYIIQELHCTTEPPRNADDQPMTTGASVTPRPMSELTSHTFHILQLKLSKIMRRINDECFGDTRPSYSTVLSIERETVRFEEDTPQAIVNMSSPNPGDKVQIEAHRLEALYLSIDTCYVRLTLTRYFAFSQLSAESESSLGSSTKDERNTQIFESSVRNICVTNCKWLISTVVVALNDWRKDVSQRLRWVVLALYTFDAALSLALCAFGRHFAAPAAQDAYTWVSLAASALRDLAAVTDTLVAKNALALTDALRAKLEAEVSQSLDGSARPTPSISASETLELAVRTLREGAPKMDELLKECRDCDALWLTTTASVYEVSLPGAETLSTLDLPAFKHFLDSCIVH